MVLFLIGILILSPLPILAMLGGIALIRHRFETTTAIQNLTGLRARGFRTSSAVARGAANRNQRTALRRAA